LSTVSMKPCVELIDLPLTAVIRSLVCRPADAPGEDGYVRVLDRVAGDDRVGDPRVGVGRSREPDARVRARVGLDLVIQTQHVTVAVE